MITPEGLPAWTRTATADSYGAVPGLHDLGNVGAVNAKTDITAAEYARMAADTVVAVRTAPLFWCTLQIATTPGNAVTVLQCQPMWDVASGSYDGSSPPTGSYPTVTFDGTDIALSFPDITEVIGGSSYLRIADDFGVYGNCQISNVSGNAIFASGAMPKSETTDGVEITVSDITADGAIVYLVVR